MISKNTEKGSVICKVKFGFQCSNVNYKLVNDLSYNLKIYVIISVNRLHDGQMGTNNKSW